MKFIFKLIVFFYSMTFNSLADFQELPEYNLDIAPTEELIFRSMSEGTKYLHVYHPSENAEYKLKTGIGCIRALLDPPETMKITAFGFGKFITGGVDNNYPILHILTPYHQVSCDIISVEIIK